METFGTYLKMLLWTKGIRAVDLAKAIDMSPATLTKYFKASSVPDRETFGKLLNYLRAFIDQEEEMRMLDLFIEEKSGFDMGIMENTVKLTDPLDRIIVEELKNLKISQKEILIKQLRKLNHENLEEIGKLGEDFLTGKIAEEHAVYDASSKQKPQTRPARPAGGAKKTGTPPPDKK